MNPLDPRRLRPAIRRSMIRSRMLARETGAATAEYAIATLAKV